MNVATAGLLAQILPVGVLLLVLELRGLSIATGSRVSALTYIYQFLSAVLGAISGLLCTFICVSVVWQDKAANLGVSVAVVIMAALLFIAVTQFVGAKFGSDQGLSDAVATLQKEREQRKAARQGRHEASSSLGD
ncbi:hypothetical protein [Clavibacter michiganensis]|uniref:hypothetical protein n=1 Tax=Clavibacter michiganensis TaxID=28447 RepID=UPI0005BD2BC0|nr:hypothetical protein [Clavibacter michiganensis]